MAKNRLTRKMVALLLERWQQKTRNRATAAAKFDDRARPAKVQPDAEKIDFWLRKFFYFFASNVADIFDFFAWLMYFC